MKVTIKGARELKESLNRLGPEVEKIIIEHAIERALTPILDEAKAICPVDPDIARGAPPGTLRDDLHIFVYGKSEKSGRLGGIVEAGGHEWGQGAFYAGFVEFGHGGPRKGGAHRNGVRNNENATPAHPFLRPSFDSQQDRAIAAFADSIRSDIAICVRNARGS